MPKHDAHEFALYVSQLSEQANLKLGKEFIVDQAELVRRISRILRLQIGETVLFFDSATHIRAQIQTIEKRTIVTRIVEKQTNKQLEPYIIVLLPFFKKEALHGALYSCTELGAQEVWLVETEKSQKIKQETNYLERLKQIAIAAAEQSKQFVQPTIQPVRKLVDVLPLFEYENSAAIFCDAAGQAVAKTIEQIKKEDQDTIILLIGPEGDLTVKEKELLKNYPFIFTKLTPTILRAPQAINISLGIIRSLF